MVPGLFFEKVPKGAGFKLEAKINPAPFIRHHLFQRRRCKRGPGRRAAQEGAGLKKVPDLFPAMEK
jgi:hypothetical protein